VRPKLRDLLCELRAMQDVCVTIEALLFLQRPVFPSELRGPLFQRPVLGSEFPFIIHTRRTPLGSPCMACSAGSTPKCRHSIGFAIRVRKATS